MVATETERVSGKRCERWPNFSDLDFSAATVVAIIRAGARWTY